ncbi:MAG: hypothetical protein AAF141_05015 [Pseudomonadota bacterium]
MRTACIAFALSLATLSACTAPTTSDLRTGAVNSAAAIDSTLNGTDGTLPADVRVPNQRPPAAIQ